MQNMPYVMQSVAYVMAKLAWYIALNFCNCSWIRTFYTHDHEATVRYSSVHQRSLLYSN